MKINNSSTANKLLLPKGASPCYNRCDCETGVCQGSYAGEPGTCSCNERTNEGCPDGYICTSVIGGDMGVSRDCYLAVGSKCPGQMPCVTLNCVNGICNCLPAKDWHNSGCPLDEYCVSDDKDNENQFEGPAHCEAKLPVGSACTGTFMPPSCSGECYEGKCACTPFSKYSGCPVGETCLGSSGSGYHGDGPFECKVRSLVGAKCRSFSDCESGICHEGSCQCNPRTYISSEKAHCFATQIDIAD